MPHGYTGVGNVFAQEVFHFGQLGNAVAHDKYLSVPAHLEVHRVGNDLMTEPVDLCTDGITVGRRRLEYRQVASTH